LATRENERLAGNILADEVNRVLERPRLLESLPDGERDINPWSSYINRKKAQYAVCQFYKSTLFAMHICPSALILHWKSMLCVIRHPLTAPKERIAGIF
jgi:hypothetical protein